EIYFTSGGSEADNQAILSAAWSGAKNGKKHIITTAIEHHAILHTFAAMEKDGFETTLLEVEPETGLVSASDVESAMREDTALVSVAAANNEIGTLQPVAEIGEICRGKGVIFHTDAVQAVGHIPINVEEQKIDMLSLAGHKFHGPKGVGALYCRSGIPLRSIIEGGAQERGKRAGTENLPGFAGMARALTDAAESLEEYAAHVIPLRDYLIDELSAIPRSHLNGDRAHRLPNNVNFCFEGVEGESLLLLLDAKGIGASSGSACTSGSLDPSHVLLAIGRPHEIAHGSLRLSLSHATTREEAEYTAAAVAEVVDYLRGMSPVWERIQNEQDEVQISSRVCDACCRANRS
ncbi:MAG: cysteine desulfurase, partial [Oscillospiraceae bacterium]|nr:cysteine desulfurase [Oscillospiraceae bacterium]